jgi:glycosyltransferase involved in cell wall biosynthesis
MKVSIVTVCLNSESTILDTLNSVINQTYKNIEHIIVDGKSKDKTKFFLKNYSFKNKKIFFLKSNGIYNALNFAIKKATGDIIHILHADDIYQSTDTISNVVKKIKYKNEKIFLSDVIYFKKNNYSEIHRFYTSKKFLINNLRYGLMPPHTGAFIKKEIYRKFLYDENYKIAGDFDFFLRTLLINKIKFFYLDLVSVRMRLGGISNKYLYSYLRITNEIKNSFKDNDLNINITYPLFRFLGKIAQLFFFKKGEVNKSFNLKISSYYKKYSNYDFIIKKNLKKLDFNKNFIYSGINLAFLGSYASNKIKKNKYLVNWPDGLYSKKVSDINIKIPGREILKSIKIPKIIKKITVMGNLSNNSYNFLKKLFNKKIINIKLPYGNIKSIIKNIHNYKISNHELIFLTIPTPKQEMLASSLAKKNKHFKIICIGGSINIASGDEKEVPKILYRFEFLWRLRYDTLRRIIRIITNYYQYLIGKFITKKINNLKIIYEI